MLLLVADCSVLLPGRPILRGAGRLHVHSHACEVPRVLSTTDRSLPQEPATPATTCIVSLGDSVHRQVVSHLSTETFKLGLTSETGSHRRTTSIDPCWVAPSAHCAHVWGNYAANVGIISPSKLTKEGKTRFPLCSIAPGGLPPVPPVAGRAPRPLHPPARRTIPAAAA